jgi:hypothetical protein
MELDYILSNVSFGGKCVKALTKRMDKALETLEKYPETADEYVDYLLFLDDIQEQVKLAELDFDTKIKSCVYKETNILFLKRWTILSEIWISALKYLI